MSQKFFSIKGSFHWCCVYHVKFTCLQKWLLSIWSRFQGEFWGLKTFQKSPILLELLLLLVETASGGGGGGAGGDVISQWLCIGFIGTITSSLPPEGCETNNRLPAVCPTCQGSLLPFASIYWTHTTSFHFKTDNPTKQLGENNLVGMLTHLKH